MDINSLYLYKDRLRTNLFVRKTILAYLIGLTILTAGCVKSDQFPDEPVITNIEFKTADTLLIVEFTDGDGDFGIAADDPDFPAYLDADSTQPNPYYNNLWIDYYEKVNGEWSLVVPENEQGFNYRVPVLTPSGQNKQLEVIITNAMEGEVPYLLSEADTFRLDVKLIDRSLKESETESTGEIVMPH